MVVSRKKRKGMGKQWEKPENKRLQNIWEQLLERYMCIQEMHYPKRSGFQQSLCNTLRYIVQWFYCCCVYKEKARRQELNEAYCNWKENNNFIDFKVHQQLRNLRLFFFFSFFFKRATKDKNNTTYSEAIVNVQQNHIAKAYAELWKVILKFQHPPLALCHWAKASDWHCTKGQWQWYTWDHKRSLFGSGLITISTIYFCF